MCWQFSAVLAAGVQSIDSRGEHLIYKRYVQD